MNQIPPFLQLSPPAEVQSQSINPPPFFSFLCLSFHSPCIIFHSSSFNMRIYIHDIFSFIYIYIYYAYFQIHKKASLSYGRMRTTHTPMPSREETTQTKVWLLLLLFLLFWGGGGRRRRLRSTTTDNASPSSSR